jgi:hypothetical protein
MSYIKLSDPNVIDLAAWQQVINVVNQHSDSISAITNNFGSQGTGETNWNTNTGISHEYDPGSQKIVYGKNKFDPTSDQITFSVANNQQKYVYYGDVEFADEVSGATSFKAKPVITATMNHSTTQTPNNADIIVTVIQVTEYGFRYRVTKSNSTLAVGIPIVGAFFINWIAIGPK